MNTSEYYKMEKYEKDYWWHRGRIAIVRKQIERYKQFAPNKKLRILNIGCGTGGTVGMLEEFGEVYNVDTEPLAIKLLTEKGFKGTVVKDLKLPYKDNYFDIVIAMDVLEHIQNESDALSEWKRVLKKKGEILITVPAYSWLWSKHDTSLHHFRRYNKAQGKVVLGRQELKITKRSYMITFSLLLVTGFRIINKFKPESDEKTSYVELPRFVNGLFSALLGVEAWWLSYFNLPFGTSLLMRAKKI